MVDSLNDSDGLFANGYFAYAYLNGPFVVMTYDNDGWGIGNMNFVTAHEMGHTFGAYDEYAASGCSPTSSFGYLYVTNTSCNNGGDTSDFSIMGEWWEQLDPSVDVSVSARGAIGWRNPAPGPVGAIVDVIRTATVSLTPYSPDPATDTTPTYLASGGNVPFPPGPGHNPVTVSKVNTAQWNVDGGTLTSNGLTPSDGAFDEETGEDFSFTPSSPIAPGSHTFGTIAINNFGHQSSIATDPLTISGAVLCAGMTPTIVGTDGNDVLTGTAGPDIIQGLRGNDTINGLGGNDILCGGPGDDTIEGGGGDDILNGGTGKDRLNGGKNNDSINAGPGDDVLAGGNGNDTMNGESGRDNLSGEGGDDSLDGGTDSDSCNGGSHVAGDTAVNCETVTGIP